MGEFVSSKGTISFSVPRPLRGYISPWKGPNTAKTYIHWSILIHFFNFFARFIRRKAFPIVCGWIKATIAPKLCRTLAVLALTRFLCWISKRMAAYIKTYPHGSALAQAGVAGPLVPNADLAAWPKPPNSWWNSSWPVVPFSCLRECCGWCCDYIQPKTWMWLPGLPFLSVFQKWLEVFFFNLNIENQAKKQE